MIKRTRVYPGMVLNIIGYDARLLLLTLCLATTVPSCSVCKHTPSGLQQNIKDSTAINFKDSLRIRDSVAVRDSLVPVPIPVEQSVSKLPAFKFPSHLETSIAESDAYVDSTGVLHHTLKNKSDKTLNAHVPVTEHFQSTEHTQQGSTVQSSEKDEKETITVEVEREFTLWEKVRLRAFWPLLLALLASLLWIFRKPILKLIKLW